MLLARDKIGWCRNPVDTAVAVVDNLAMTLAGLLEDREQLRDQVAFLIRRVAALTEELALAREEPAEAK